MLTTPIAKRYRRVISSFFIPGNSGRAVTTEKKQTDCPPSNNNFISSFTSLDS